MRGSRLAIPGLVILLSLGGVALLSLFTERALPIWLAVAIAVVSFALSGVLGLNAQPAFEAFWNYVRASVTNPQYTIMLSARYRTSSWPDVSAIASALIRERGHDLELTLHGSNYVEFQMLTPPASLLLSIQPDTTAAFDRSDESLLFEDVGEVAMDRDPSIVRLHFTQPLVIRYHERHAISRDALESLAEALRISRDVTGGKNVQYTVIVHRVGKEALRAARAPSRSAVRREDRGVVEIRDAQTIQYIAANAADISRNLGHDMAGLHPVSPTSVAGTGMQSR